MPFELWNWADKVGARRGEMEAWRTLDLAEAIAARIDYPVHLENDATAACGAELMLGHGSRQRDFLYFFIGSFIGGGVVLDGKLYCGRHGNAGALGSMPVDLGRGRPAQLIDAASLFLLEDKLKERGLDPVAALYGGSDWSGFEREARSWIGATAGHLARAIVTAAAVLDVPTVVIDGGLPGDVKHDLVEATRTSLLAFDMQGLVAPEVLGGLVGANARAIGGACLPLLERFLLDHRGAVRSGPAELARLIGNAPGLP
jgi:predicted NBD/HSP70 family sugar kinase